MYEIDHWTHLTEHGYFARISCVDSYSTFQRSIQLWIIGIIYRNYILYDHKC